MERARFRPRMALGLLYFFAFFFLFAMAFVFVPLLETFRTLTPEQQQDLELASRIAQDAFRGRFWLTVVVAAAVTGFAANLGALPGLRRPG